MTEDADFVKTVVAVASPAQVWNFQKAIRVWYLPTKWRAQNQKS